LAVLTSKVSVFIKLQSSKNYYKIDYKQILAGQKLIGWKIFSPGARTARPL